MTASETDPSLRAPLPPLAPPSGADRDAPVGPRRLLFGLVLLGLGFLIGGVTPWLGGGENVVAARMGIAILLLVVGLVLLARRPSLALGGLGALLGLFLHANPYYGDRSTEWPWQQWLSSNLLDQRIDIALWVGAAVLALLRAYLGRGRALLLGSFLLGILTVIRLHAEGGGMPFIRNEEHLDLSWSLTIVSLGAAAVLCARGSTGGRRSAATLAVLGTLVAATIYLAWFPGTTGLSMAQHYYLRAGRAWDTLVGSTEASPQVREGVYKDVLGRIAPFWCMVAALPVLWLAVLPSRATKLSRVLGMVAVALILLRWFIPAGAELYFQREFLRIRGPSLVCAIVGDALTGAGLAAWVLLSSTSSLLLSEASTRGAAAPPAPVSPPVRPLTATPYVLTLLLLLVALYAAFNPESGTVYRAWPLDLPRDPFWNQPMAGFVLGGASILALAIAALTPAGRARGLVALGGLLVGMAALAGPDPTAYLYGVRPFVPPVLMALAVAGATAARGGRGDRAPKTLVWASGLFLLLILLYPLPVPGGGASDRLVEPRSMITGLVITLQRLPTFGARGDYLVETYGPLLVVLTLAVVVLAALAARRPGRRPVALWIVFTLALAYPILHTAWRVASDPLNRVGEPFPAFVRRLAQDLSVYYLPHALGLAAAVGDLFLGKGGGSRGPPGAGPG